MPDTLVVHQDAVLSNLAEQFGQGGLWIADQVLPVLQVKKESDKYYKFYLKDIATRIGRTQRADGAEAAESDYDLTTSTYQCEEYALRGLVTDRSRSNADQPLSMEEDTLHFLTENLLLDREMRVAAAVFNTSTFASYYSALSGNDCWDVYTDASSDPLEDMEVAKKSVLQNAGKMPNTVIMGYEVFEHVRRHPEILDIVKYGGTPADPAVIGEPELAKAFGVDKVLVGKSVYNSNTEGQTASYGFVWGKYCMVAYIAPTPPRKGVTLGCTFRAQSFNVSRYREDKRKGDMLEVSMIDDEVIITTGAG